MYLRSGARVEDFVNMPLDDYRMTSNSRSLGFDVWIAKKYAPSFTLEERQQRGTVEEMAMTALDRPVIAGDIGHSTVPQKTRTQRRLGVTHAARAPSCVVPAGLVRSGRAAPVPALADQTPCLLAERVRTPDRKSRE
ncbi:hypothetical protein EVAR_46013_1 [Eumeta japonica]|uniref:Uncharacterized protein n=1 Tax=Eumeta variegata TaxID=151549 RepID=A0A4C1XBX3_EUMVA|nr:hypothetical protein EVAR_46013_1 [Eumeta japonica]